MKSATEWNHDILDITMHIHQKFPELSENIDEMPLNFSEKEKKGINLRNLEEYYLSLLSLLEEYTKTHSAEKRTL